MTPRFLLRIVALSLVPCLIFDPVLAQASELHSATAPGRPMVTIFKHEALVEPLVSSTGFNKTRENRAEPVSLTLGRLVIGEGWMQQPHQEPQAQDQRGPGRKRPVTRGLVEFVKSGEGKDHFTSREIEVIELVEEGKKDYEIASILGISAATVARHLTNATAKWQKSLAPKLEILPLRRENKRSIAPGLRDFIAFGDGDIVLTRRQLDVVEATAQEGNEDIEKRLGIFKGNAKKFIQGAKLKRKEHLTQPGSIYKGVQENGATQVVFVQGQQAGQFIYWDNGDFSKPLTASAEKLVTLLNKYKRVPLEQGSRFIDKSGEKAFHWTVYSRFEDNLYVIPTASSDSPPKKLSMGTVAENLSNGTIEMIPPPSKLDGSMLFPTEETLDMAGLVRWIKSAVVNQVIYLPKDFYGIVKSFTGSTVTLWVGSETREFNIQTLAQAYHDAMAKNLHREVSLDRIRESDTAEIVRLTEGPTTRTKPTPTEQRVVRGARFFTNKGIAIELEIQVNTAKLHLVHARDAMKNLVPQIVSGVVLLAGSLYSIVRMLHDTPAHASAPGFFAMLWVPVFANWVLPLSLERFFFALNPFMLITSGLLVIYQWRLLNKGLPQAPPLESWKIYKKGNQAFLVENLKKSKGTVDVYYLDPEHLMSNDSRNPTVHRVIPEEESMRSSPVEVHKLRKLLSTYQKLEFVDETFQEQGNGKRIFTIKEEGENYKVVWHTPEGDLEGTLPAREFFRKNYFERYRSAPATMAFELRNAAKKLSMLVVAAIGLAYGFHSASHRLTRMTVVSA